MRASVMRELVLAVSMVGILALGCSGDDDAADDDAADDDAGDDDTADDDAADDDAADDDAADDDAADDDTADDDTADDDTADDDAADDDDAEPYDRRLDTLVAEVAAETCDVLFRCCTSSDIEIYASPMVMNARVDDAGLVEMLPPEATLTAEDCPAVIAAVLEVQPLGPWVEQAKLGQVLFHPAASDACLETLRDAACGEAAWSALLDSECFAFSSPYGGDRRRSMFDRFADVGDACVGLTDGVGGAFYGTCDPRYAWCCRPSAEDPAVCGLTEGAAGECVAAAAEGEPCGLLPPMQVCRTGLSCDPYDDVCVDDGALTALDEGDACAADFSLLGDCVDSYCDLFGSEQCEPLAGDGADCFDPWECESGFCVESVCVPLPYCVGDDAPAGACDADDQVEIETPAFSAAVEDCAMGCAMGLDLTAGCVQTCLAADTDLSEGCATCFSEIVGCSFGACLLECMDSASAACTSCTQTNCAPAFEECSGLEY